MKRQTQAVAISTTHAESFDSKSRPGVKHLAVINISVTCGCEGFQSHKHCWHVEQTMSKTARAMLRAVATSKRARAKR